MIKILLIESSSILRNQVQGVVEQEHDLQLVAAFSEIKAALSILNSGLRAEVLVAEFSAPEVDLYHQIRDLQPGIKIVFVVRDEMPDLLIKALRAGANSCILTGDNDEELIYSIRSAFGNRRFLSSRIVTLLSRHLIEIPTFKLADTVNFSLSERDTEVLVRIAEGFTNAEIADQMFTSRRTIEGYRQSLLTRAKVKNTAALIKFCIKNGFLEI